MKFGNIRAVGQIIATGSLVSNTVTLITGSAQLTGLGFATTGSNTFSGNQTINATLGVTIGDSTELNVQQSGVTIGNVVTDTHRITGSLNVSGSLVTMGNIGVGLTPTTALHFAGDLTQQTSLNTTAQYWLITRKSRGTTTSPTTVLVNDEAGGIQFTGYDGAAWRAGAAIRSKIESVSLGSLSSNLEFFAGNGSPSVGTQVMTMRGDTKFVGIGTTAPPEPLSVSFAAHGLISQHRQSSGVGVGQNFYMKFNTANGTAANYAGIYADIQANTDGAQSGKMILQVANAGSLASVMTLTNTSNVGIGTTTPPAKLTVQSIGATGILLEQDGTNNAVSSRLVARNNSIAGTIRYDSGGWRFNTNATLDATSGTERALISTDGYFRMLSGTGGIQFQGTTGVANALNYYEEGTWTPSIVGGGGGEATYPSLRLGWYTRIGRSVTITWFVSITKNNMSGTLRMTGLPFTLLGGSAHYPQGTVLLDSLATATNNITFQAATNTTTGDFIGGNGSTSTHTGLPISVLGSGTMECRGTVTYFV